MPPDDNLFSHFSQIAATFSPSLVGEIYLAQTFTTMPKDENYLETFTPKELMEVVIHPEDWHAADVKQARQILKQKGVTKRDIADYKQRLAERALKGERANMGVLALGFVSALLGGILGILIGYYLMTSKKEVGGKQVMHYDEPTRKLGKIILALGVVGAVVWTVLYLTR